MGKMVQEPTQMQYSHFGRLQIHLMVYVTQVGCLIIRILDPVPFSNFFIALQFSHLSFRHRLNIDSSIFVHFEAIQDEMIVSHIKWIDFIYAYILALNKRYRLNAAIQTSSNVI